jgi:hypothetical protein
MGRTISMFTVLVAVLAALPAVAKEGETRARAFLIRSAGSPDGDVKGYVEIRSEPERGRERFKAQVEKIGPGATVMIRIGDGNGGMVEVATMAADAAGEAELELATNDGAALPAGASRAADLSGRTVEVVDAQGRTLLTGTVPSFGGGTTPGTGGSSGGEATSDVNVDRRARSFLTRVPGASDDDAKGHVDIRSDRGREKIEIQVEHLAPGAAVSMEIGDGDGGTIDLGTLVADATGQAELERNTGDGDPLPGGAATAEELSGRPVTIRDASGARLLEGTVPSFGDSPRTTLRARLESRDDATGAKAKVDLKARRDGSSRLKLKLKGLPRNAALELWVEDGAGMAKAADLEPSSRGKARLKLDTKKGDSMLLGLPSAADLAGRAWQVRDAAGDVILDAEFPSI